MTSLSSVSSFHADKFKHYITQLKRTPTLEGVKEVLSMLETSAVINAYSKTWEVCQTGLRPQPLSRFIKKLSKAVFLLKDNCSFRKKANDLLIEFRVKHNPPSDKKNYIARLIDKSHTTSKKPERDKITISTNTSFLFDLPLFHQHITKLKTNPKLDDIKEILQMLKNSMIVSSVLNERVVLIEKDRFQPLSFFIKQISEVIDSANKDSDFYIEAILLLASFKEESSKPVVQYSSINTSLDLLCRKEAKKSFKKSMLSHSITALDLSRKNIVSINNSSENSQEVLQA